MNLRDLHYFIAVAEYQHFGKAAQACHVSQPTLSGQLKKLEEELGVLLFERSNRRVNITSAGKRILHSAQSIFQETQRIKQIAQEAKDPLGGDFRIGAFPTLAPYFFPLCMRVLKKALPKIRFILVEAKTDELLEKLKKREVDVAFLALPVLEAELVSQKLFEDPFYLAVPPNHPLSAEKKISYKQLAGYRMLLLEEGHCLRDQALEVCHSHRVQQEEEFKATSLETLRQMVKAGTGITFIPEIAIQPNDNEIHYLPFATKDRPVRDIGLVWRGNTMRHQVIDKIIEVTKR